MADAKHPEPKNEHEPVKKAKSEDKGPEVVDIDLTRKLLQIANGAQGNAAYRAIGAAAANQLNKINAQIQESIDKVRQAETDRINEEEDKRREEVIKAQRKAEDDRRKAEDEARKAEAEAAKKVA